MQLHPVKASEWVTFTKNNKDLLLSIGAVPVNDVFLPHYNDRSPIRLFYGSYGSGKSVFIADDLIDKALNDPYFRCYYGRKVFDTVRVSQFETLVDRIEERGLQAYFKYSRADNSSMVIHCVLNGNKFIPFGGDKADKLKSIKDPTHIWCEEFDQFEDGEGEKQGDFQLLFPRLRTTKAQCEFIGSFNTAPVFENHWILKYFFPDLYRGDDKPAEWFNDIFKGLRISKCFANYTDNYFIDKEAYFRQLQLASGGNQLILDAIANGAWGVLDNKNPWLYAFDREKHTRPMLPFLPTFDVYISFDFNNDPFACTAWQMSPDKGTSSSFIHCIKEFSGSLKVEEMCQRIKTEYPTSILHITGDRSGQNEDIGRNQTLYDMIAAYLGVSRKLMDLNTHNLEHADSRIFMNAMMANYPNLLLSQEGCPNLIRQMQNAKVNVDDKKPGMLLKDRGMHKNDEFDSARYFFQTYFHDFAKKTYIRVLKK